MLVNPQPEPEPDRSPEKPGSGWGSGSGSLALWFCIAFFAFPTFAQIFTNTIPFTLTGTAPAGARVHVEIEGGATGETTADASGNWSLLWTAPLKTGTYDVHITVNGTTTTTLLRVQLTSNLQRQSPLPEPPPRYGNVEALLPEAAMEMTDRWRIAPPPYELDENPRHRRLDPYNKNRIKGDFPI
ncbi:MAG TPA: Ig-like domain-containing protein, partial [Thermoanaerobaculia bacterium]|nr:Ig-like domain-containing protein [Thermoanaerobaculia bacterium]